MTSTALFYADQLGIEGVNPNGLDDLNDMIRGSHLVNPVNVNASYGANGRGVLLLDGDSNSAEIAVNGDQKITRNGNVALNDNVLIDLSDVSTVGTIGAGQLLARNAGNTGWENQDAPAAGAAGVIQVDTYETASGSFSYIVPAGVTALRVTASAGGASGTAGAVPTVSNTAVGGFGGNAGQYDVRYIPVTGSGQTLSVVIGGAASNTSISGTGISTSTWTAGAGSSGFGPSSTDRTSGTVDGRTRVTTRGGVGIVDGSTSAEGGGQGGNTPRANGGGGGTGAGSGFSFGSGGGGGGAGWVDGSVGGNAGAGVGGTGSAGGRGGMVIEALGVTVNVN